MDIDNKSCLTCDHFREVVDFNLCLNDNTKYTIKGIFIKCPFHEFKTK